MSKNLYCKGQLTLSKEGKERWDKIVWDKPKKSISRFFDDSYLSVLDNADWKFGKDSFTIDMPPIFAKKNPKEERTANEL